MKERIFDAFGGFGFGILVNVTKNKYFDFWCHNLALLFVITVRRHFESIYIVLVFLNSLQFSVCVVNWNRKPPCPTYHDRKKGKVSPMAHQDDPAQDGRGAIGML